MFLKLWFLAHIKECKQGVSPKESLLIRKSLTIPPL